jgi:hypothetical protein
MVISLTCPVDDGDVDDVVDEGVEDVEVGMAGTHFASFLEKL